MGRKSTDHFPLWKITNTWTGESFEARGWKQVTALAGIKTNRNTLSKMKKWKIEQLADPIVWDESSYRSKLYKSTKHRYKGYEERKLLRDPLFESRKRMRIKGWINPKTLQQLTAEEHSIMIEQPCAVCGSVDAVGVDHCHNSNIVRDSLCRHCNLALGYVKDDPNKLELLAQYLRKHEKDIAECLAKMR